MGSVGGARQVMSAAFEVDLPIRDGGCLMSIGAGEWHDVESFRCSLQKWWLGGRANLQPRASGGRRHLSQRGRHRAPRRRRPS